MQLDERNAILAELRSCRFFALETLFTECPWVEDVEVREIQRLLSDLSSRKQEIDRLAQENARLKAANGHLQQELAMRPER